MSYVQFSMKDALKNHVLEEVPGSEKLRAFYLTEPGQGRAMSTLIVFTPEGIVVMGDLCPNLNGAISVYNYGLSWFSKDLSEEYLCEKFLQKEWQPALAQAYCYDMAAEARKGLQDDRDSKLQSVADERSHCLENLRTLHSMRSTDSEDRASYEDEKAKLKEILAAQRSLLVDLREALADRYQQLALDIEGWGYGMERFAEELEEIDSCASEDGVPGTGFPLQAAGWLCAIQQRFAELYGARVEA